MSILRPNLYADVPLRQTGMSNPTIAVIVGVLCSVVLLLLAAYLVYRCFCRAEKSPRGNISTFRTLPSSNSPLFESGSYGGLSASAPARWRRVFDRVLNSEGSGTQNVAALHAILCVPADLQLSDPRENAELSADKDRLARAHERRRTIDSILPINTTGIITTTGQREEERNFREREREKNLITGSDRGARRETTAAFGNPHEEPRGLSLHQSYDQHYTGDELGEKFHNPEFRDARE